MGLGMGLDGHLSPRLDSGPGAIAVRRDQLQAANTCTCICSKEIRFTAALRLRCGCSPFPGWRLKYMYVLAVIHRHRLVSLTTSDTIAGDQY